MRIDMIPTGDNVPDSLNVIIEVPVGGEPVKYEFDKASGALFVDRFLHTAMYYPGNYGLIPQTRSDDGDPCDVMVVGQVPVVAVEYKLAFVVAAVVALAGLLDTLRLPRGAGDHFVARK